MSRAGTERPGTAGVTADVVSRLRAAGCVFAEDEARLLLAEAHTPAELDALVERRVAGVPLEQVLGWAEFCGLRVAVAPGVFVPRRRTELLVHAAVELLQPRSVVVDLCCGAGGVATAVGTAVPGVELLAADIDPAAVRCARRNVSAVGGRVHEGDLFDALPASLRGRVDVLVANPPYVPTRALATLPPEAREHEPRVALDGGADGLDLLRRIVAGAPQWLGPAGHVLVETSEAQAPALLAEVGGAGLVPRVVRSPGLGATVVVGSRPVRRLQAGDEPPQGL